MIFLLLFLLSGCTPRVKPIIKEDDKTLVNEANRLVIEPESIFTKVPQFSYKSDMAFLVGKKESVKEDREIVTVIAKNPRILFKKKIDNFHFLEMFIDDSNFFIKNANGPWRRKINDTSMHKDLLKDGLNLVAWIIEQCELDAKLTATLTNTSKVFSIKNGSIAKDAPLIKNIVNKNPQFSVIFSSTVNATIIVDNKTELPVSADFDIAIIGQEQHWIRIIASQVFDMSSDHDLVKPKIENMDPMNLSMPVNIASRFNKLVNDMR